MECNKLIHGLAINMNSISEVSEFYRNTLRLRDTCFIRISMEKFVWPRFGSLQSDRYNDDDRNVVWNSRTEENTRNLLVFERIPRSTNEITLLIHGHSPTQAINPHYFRMLRLQCFREKMIETSVYQTYKTPSKKPKILFNISELLWRNVVDKIWLFPTTANNNNEFSKERGKESKLLAHFKHELLGIKVIYEVIARM